MFAILLLIAATAIAAPAIQWGNIPLSFEPNTGQASAQVRYLAQGSSYTLYLTCGEALLAGHNDSFLRTKLSGANPACRIAGEATQQSTSNYFVGNDATKWRTAIPNYARVRTSNVYPGIDLLYYGKDGHLEYDWIVAPGADPSHVRMIFDHADRMRIDKHGDLVIQAGKSEYRHKQPVAYQEIGGARIAVAAIWSLS